jgi:hypothetical protein
MPSNFNSTTPAAPAGSTNVIFQTDGAGNDSGYVPSSAIALAPVVALTQSANIVAGNIPALVTVVANRRYRISAYIIVTTVDPVSSTLPQVKLTWTDADNATPQSLVLTATNAGNTLTTYMQASCVISVEAGTSVTYETDSYASNTPATMQYALHLISEAL